MTKTTALATTGLLALLAACGGGGSSGPVAPTPVAQPAPPADDEQDPEPQVEPDVEPVDPAPQADDEQDPEPEPTPPPKPPAPDALKVSDQISPTDATATVRVTRRGNIVVSFDGGQSLAARRSIDFGKPDLKARPFDLVIRRPFDETAFTAVSGLDASLWGVWAEGEDDGIIHGHFPADHMGAYHAGERTNDMPTTGSATYTGSAVGYMNDVGVLEGPATFSANFRRGTINGRIAIDDSLDQQLDVVTTTGRISGSTFAGDAVSVNGFTGTHEGQFNGQAAAEVSGVAMLSNGERDMLLAFGAAK